jgi:hypothetical protein
MYLPCHIEINKIIIDPINNSDTKIYYLSGLSVILKPFIKYIFLLKSAY